MMAITLECYAQHISGETACTKAKAWLTTKTKALAKEESAAKEKAKEESAAKQSTAAKTKHSEATINDSSELENAETIIADSCETYYAVNVGNRSFVIVGGDEQLPDILGYSTESTFDADDLPPALRLWLANISLNTTTPTGLTLGDSISENKTAPNQKTATNQETATTTTTTNTSTTTAPIAPLLTTVWGQNSPYNLQAPLYDGTNQAAAGCIPVAMAQVINYHKPLTISTIPAYISVKDGYTIKMPTLPSTTINWQTLLDRYTTTSSTASRDEVSRLLLYCGQACQAKYGATTSATMQNTADGLRQYFGMASTTQIVSRAEYSQNAWHTMIYRELSESRPVILDGHNISVGHAFVCDGYDGEGMFHINWGWEGKSNGYFLIDNLSPVNQGTGGSNHGYSYNNNAIIGIQPDDNASPIGDTSTESHGKTVSILCHSMAPSWGRERVGYNIIYDCTLTNTGTTFSTPLYIYLDGSLTPETMTGMNIDPQQSGHAYFNTSFTTSGSHTIALKDKNGKTLHTRTAVITEAPEHTVKQQYAWLTKCTNNRLKANTVSIRYYLTNNGTQTYDDYAQIALYRITSYTYNDDGTIKGYRGVLADTQWAEMNVQPGVRKTADITFTDLLDNQEYWISLRYLTYKDGTTQWVGNSTTHFGYFPDETETDAIISPTLPSPRTSAIYNIHGQRITTPPSQGLYIIDGKKYIK